MYGGRPAAIAMGGVPVAWTNCYENASQVRPVHAGGDFCISVTLGARAADIARNARIDVVLRVSVLGDELAGPEHNAPAAAGKAGGAVDKNADNKGNSSSAGDSGGTGGAGWTGIAAAAGAGAVVVVIAGLVFVRGRRGRTAQTTRGSA